MGTGFQDKEPPMKCVLCRHGETEPGKVTVTLQRGETAVIIKDVPARICENCGEYYLEEGITEQVLSMAEEAVKKNTEVEILRFAA
jgi:YgiT-type zinc finger domain-containing protein